MAARGLAPRCTPGAIRLARHSATAYSAIDGCTGTDSVARWAPSHSSVRADRQQLDEGVLAAAVQCELRLVRRVGVAERRRHGEAVELALDQREGPPL